MALMLPMSGHPMGRQVAGAAALAVEKVNNEKMLPPGLTLEYSWANSGCSAKQALVAMGELMGQSSIDAVIGPACSSACEVIGYLSKTCPLSPQDFSTQFEH